ncbi:LCP family protein [Zhihengliuella sp.]|uniref:LCP family protein n=1 Tax=Zhihengliuella sp. TaxID=1954483 RepID=UPI002812616E|nr:LCP family protein [Zhihengliuella sp.]
MLRSDSPSRYTPRHRAEGSGRRSKRPALFAALALVLIALVGAGGYVGNLLTTFSAKANTVDAGLAGRQVNDVDGSRNILLLGSDSRGDGQDVASVKGEDGKRSDTMMLVHIPKDRSGIYVMSLVRDLWVDVPGHGERKINAAYNIGGYPLVVDTVEDLLGTQIDNVASIDFGGFSALTEALGGVTVDNPRAFCTGHTHPTCFEAGTTHLEGNEALRFVRERKAFAEGDFQRVQNQQLFIKAVLKDFLNPATLSNPVKVHSIVDKFSEYITVDQTLDGATIAGLAVELKDVRTRDVHFFTIPTGPPGEGPGGAEIILQDEEALAALRTALRTDTLDEFVTSGIGTNAYGGAISNEVVADPAAPETPQAGE